MFRPPQIQKTRKSFSTQDFKGTTRDALKVPCMYVYAHIYANVIQVLAQRLTCTRSMQTRTRLALSTHPPHMILSHLNTQRPLPKSTEPQVINLYPNLFFSPLVSLSSSFPVLWRVSISINKKLLEFWRFKVTKVACVQPKLWHSAAGVPELHAWPLISLTCFTEERSRRWGPLLESFNKPW